MEQGLGGSDSPCPSPTAVVWGGLQEQWAVGSPLATPCLDCCSLPVAGGPAPQHHCCPGFPSPWPGPPSPPTRMNPFPKPHSPVLLSCECPPVLVTGEQCW